MGKLVYEVEDHGESRFFVRNDKFLQEHLSKLLSEYGTSASFKVRGAEVSDEFYNDLLEDQPEGLSPRLRALADQLQDMAEKDEEVQFAVDELIYDHCGTSKRWSNVNNQGIETQVEALAEHLDEDELIGMLGEVIEEHSA